MVGCFKVQRGGDGSLVGTHKRRIKKGWGEEKKTCKSPGGDARLDAPREAAAAAAEASGGLGRAGGGSTLLPLFLILSHSPLDGSSAEVCARGKMVARRFDNKRYKLRSKTRWDRNDEY